MAYLDHAATTPVRPEARDAMLPWLGDRVGNPSGAHRRARDARRAVDDARDVFAAAIGFAPGEIVFTGGGTESDNLAVLGVAEATGGVPVCAATEHHAVLHAVEARGGRVVPVDRAGRVDPDRLAAALGPDVAVVSVMAVNNETGIVADLDAVVDCVRANAPGAVVHTDAVQATCLDLPSLLARVDLVSLSAHKFGGPQGVGVLGVRDGVPLRARMIGGGQERDRRAGTHNVAGACGAAAAMTVTVERRDTDGPRLAALRDRLVAGVRDAVDDVVETAVVDGRRVATTPTHAHLCFPDVEAEALLVLLEDREVYASAASSCASGAQQISHVLAAMGVDDRLVRGSLRLSLGWSTTETDVDVAAAAVAAAVERVRMFA